MQISRQTLILFSLNFLDAVFTIYWVRHGLATEGNQLMSGLLDMGNMPFLAVKTMIGGVAAFVLWRWGNLRLAQVGLSVALAIYIGLMGVHLFTGLSACGLISENFLRDISNWSGNYLALII